MLSSEVSAYNDRIRRLRTGDALLTTNTPAEAAANAARVGALTGGTNNLGRTWGFPEPDSMGVNLVSGIRDALSSMSSTDAARVARRIKDAMEAYAGAERSSRMEVDPTGTLVTAGANPSTASTDASLRHLSADGREGVSRVRQMNEAAKAFWSRQPRP